jgi:hypothetical protein
MDDIRRFQAVSGDCLRGTLNLDGILLIVLIVHVEDPVWADILGLGGCKEGTML